MVQAAQPAERASACSRTFAAFSCLSGGYPCLRRMRLTSRRRLARTFSRSVAPHGVDQFAGHLAQRLVAKLVHAAVVCLKRVAEDELPRCWRPPLILVSGPAASRRVWRLRIAGVGVVDVDRAVVELNGAAAARAQQPIQRHAPQPDGQLPQRQVDRRALPSDPSGKPEQLPRRRPTRDSAADRSRRDQPSPTAPLAVCTPTTGSCTTVPCAPMRALKPMSRDRGAVHPEPFDPEDPLTRDVAHAELSSVEVSTAALSATLANALSTNKSRPGSYAPE